MSPLFVDARLLFASGIGRYLREILSRWPSATTGKETFFCTTAEQEEWLRVHRPGATILRRRTALYGPGEQLLALTVPARAIYWVPHYNLPLLCRARLVTTVHDAAPLALPEVFHRRGQQLAARCYFGAARRADQIITVSQFSADELHRLARVPRAKISVVPNGVSPDWFQTDLPVRRDPARLLFVGNLKPHKNLARLVTALELVRAAGHPGLELDVIGQVDGFRTGLESAFAEKLRATPWIHRHGLVRDTELRGFYARATALVFPSLYEGFGLPMLEAMAGGCPVLAARASSLPEIGGPDVSAGGAVAYFDPLDPCDIAATITAFLRLPPEMRTQLGLRGGERARLYSWDAAARATLAHLRVPGSGVEPDPKISHPPQPASPVLADRHALVP